MGSHLLTRTVAYEGDALSAVAVEALASAARARHQQRLAAFAALRTEQEALRKAVVDGLPADPPPPGLLDRLSSWFVDPAPRADLELLESRLETAQRRVLEIAHAIDRVSTDCARQRTELASLRAKFACAGNNARLAAEEILAVQAALATARSVDDPDADALEALLWEREAELRGFGVIERRLRAVAELEHDFLRLNERLRESLSILYDAATEALDELDRHVARLAVQARAADLSRAVSSAMASLQTSVQRVDLAAVASGKLLHEHLDRLSDEVDLLAPADPRRAAAEAEVARALRNRTVEEVVARARAEVARKADDRF